MPGLKTKYQLTSFQASIHLQLFVGTTSQFLITDSQLLNPTCTYMCIGLFNIYFQYDQCYDQCNDSMLAPGAHNPRRGLLLAHSYMRWRRFTVKLS